MKESNNQSSLVYFRQYAHTLMHTRTNVTNQQYNINIANDLLFNERTHLVSIFKDYLILDDTSEFFKRFYRKKELRSKLGKILDYYERSSRVFPNYTKLQESKYIYKNIQKKQKVIDEIQEMDNENNEKIIKESRNRNNGRFQLSEIFDTEAVELINQPSKSDYIGFELFCHEVETQDQNMPSVEENEVNRIQKIIEDIENEEKRLESFAPIQTEVNQNKDIKFKNLKHILLTQTFILKNKTRKNEGLITTKSKIPSSIRSARQYTDASNTSNSVSTIQNPKTHRILKSCIFSVNQQKKFSTSIGKVNSYTNTNNDLIYNNTINNNLYLKTDTCLSPTQRKTSLENQLFQKLALSTNHNQHQRKYTQHAKLLPHTIHTTSRERNRTHLTTVTSPLPKKLCIPMISNRPTLKGIQIHNFNDIYQSTQPNTISAKRKTLYMNSMTSRNTNKMQTDRILQKSHPQLSSKRGKS